jgi:uncharacterized membrane protein
MKVPLRWRRYFLVGLVVIAPVGATAWVLAWLFQTIDAILGEPLQAAIGFHVPGLGFLLLGVFVLLVGWVVHQAVGRRVLDWWNEALGRFPVAGRLYHAASQIMQTIVGGQQAMFRRTVLVPYPMEGMWAVAFVTSDDPPGISALVGEPCANVFVPTTPNPTSGFLLVVPTRLMRPLGLSVEEAMKLVISAGALTPSRETLPAHRGLDLDTLLKERR